MHLKRDHPNTAKDPPKTTDEPQTNPNTARLKAKTSLGRAYIPHPLAHFLLHLAISGLGGLGDGLGICIMDEKLLVWEWGVEIRYLLQGTGIGGNMVREVSLGVGWEGNWVCILMCTVLVLYYGS